jgi:hypothetical protein
MVQAHRSDAVLVRSAALRSGDVDRLNALLDGAGLGRPLAEPALTGHELVEVPLAGADPVAVREAVGAARGRGDQVPELMLDMTYAVDAGAPAPSLVAAGNKIGHGVPGWLPVPLTRMPPAPPWRPAGNQPVVAILDSGVRLHHWLPEPFHGERFCIGIGAEDIGWTPPVQVRTETTAGGDLASHHGHGTFVAGLVRQVAPRAQVLSLRVLGADGLASEENVISALTWLAGDYLATGARLDVVLMAFGRPAPAGLEDAGRVEELRHAVAALAGRGVKVVASAGNDGTDRPTVPASFADDLGAPVVSVGSGGSANDPAWFSNRGTWVKQWRPGSDLLSIMPMQAASSEAWGCATSCFGAGFSDALPPDGDGAARWSGTSFSAAVYAAELTGI